MEPRLLFPDLPAELRNIVYSNTICNSQPAINAGLPFESKTYTFSHTKVVLTPVHYGIPNLLTLQKYRFLEASEYRDYLLTHAIQLRISIHFHGHMHIFVQEHWDQKMSAYLKNLFKKFPFLDKVANYDIRIFWEPNAFTLEKKRRNIGVIAKRMVEVVTAKLGADLKMKKGFVKATLQIERYVAWDYEHERRSLGFAEFAEFDSDMIWKQQHEVRIPPTNSRVRGEGYTSNSATHWKIDPRSHLIFEIQTERKKDGMVVRSEVVGGKHEKSNEVPFWLQSLITEFKTTRRLE